MGKCYIKAYYGWIEQTAALSDAERGRLFTAILEYARSGLDPKLGGREGILFPVFQASVDRDKEISRINSKNGALSRGKKATESEIKRNEATESDQRVYIDVTAMDITTKDVATKKDTTQITKEDEEKEKEINKEKEKSSCISHPSPSALDEFFNSVWRLYPVKRGKGQVSQSKRLVLYKIGFERISLAISRYLEDLRGDTWRKPQNGSTFFSSGYIDYLDENYTPSERRDANGRPQGGGSEVPLYGHYV